jgi:hypothetical protein
MDSKVHGIECICLNDETFIVAAESDTDATSCINGVLGTYYPYSSAEWIATSVTCGSSTMIIDWYNDFHSMKDRIVKWRAQTY